VSPDEQSAMISETVAEGAAITWFHAERALSASGRAFAERHFGPTE